MITVITWQINNTLRIVKAQYSTKNVHVENTVSNLNRYTIYIYNVMNFVQGPLILCVYFATLFVCPWFHFTKRRIIDLTRTVEINGTPLFDVVRKLYLACFFIIIRGDVIVGQYWFDRAVSRISPSALWVNLVRTNLTVTISLNTRRHMTLYVIGLVYLGDANGLSNSA